ANATEQADAVVAGHRVVDHFGEQHGLADASPTEQARLATALERHEHIDGLDTRLEDLRLGSTLGECWRGAMDRPELDILEVRTAIDSATEYVEHPRANRLTHRHFERP